MVTVILTKYKRTNLFDEQYQSVLNQTLKPTEILVCDNTTQNTGVWGRFSLALLAKNDFVCVIDDDTIPGNSWLQNCVDCFQEKEGLYGTCGYLFNSNTHYQDNYTRHGWCNPNEEIKEVDYVVHNWFFKKEWLKYYWSEIRNEKYWLCGEDMNFSYQLQKQGIKTFVPPHPKDNGNRWGSIKGWQYGIDSVSLYETNPENFRQNMFDFFDEQIKKGWKLLYES
jgi:GT2 family glycosyltransferase